jgi:UDP-N-acetylmuramyl pentapeptide phosphotransferase/UDP-N-acetylglucosamine-1-phosphate transferase
MRFAIALAALVSAASPTISCTHLTPVEQQLLDCGSQAVQQQIPALLPQVSSILNSGSVNWQDGLNTLLSTAGSAVICAVQVAISDLESKAQAGASVAPAQLVAISRGEAWLNAHPNLVAAAHK